MSTEPSSRDHLPHRVVDLRAVGHVAPHGHGSPAERADLVDRLLGVHHPLRDGRLREDAEALGSARVGLEQDVGDRDVRAGARERQRVDAPEPA